MSVEETSLRVGIDGTGAVTGSGVVNRSLDAISSKAARAEATITNLDNKLGKVGTTSKGISVVKRDIDDINKSTIQWGTLLDQIQDRILRVGASTLFFYGLGKAIGSVVGALKESLIYMGQLESATLGIASSFLVSGNFTDSLTGKVLKGQTALTASLHMSKDVIEQLKVANMQTIATLDQLIVAYQVTLPVAMSRGFDKQKVMDFTLAMVQAAGAIGLPFDQMAEETRSLLMGTINPRTSRIATVLGLRNEDIKEFKGNAQGLFDFLMGRLEGFRIAGIESQKTWAGLMSNFKDIAKQAGGFAFEGLFKGIKVEIKELMDSVITIDNETKKIKWNQEFIRGAQNIGEQVTEIFKAVVTGTKFIFEHASAIGLVIEMYLKYKIGILAVSLAQKALNTDIAQSFILAERVATRQASYISSPRSDSLRAAQSLQVAQATAAETAAEVNRAKAIHGSNMAVVESIKFNAQHTLGLQADALAAVSNNEAILASNIARKESKLAYIAELEAQQISLAKEQEQIIKRGLLVSVDKELAVVETELSIARKSMQGTNLQISNSERQLAISRESVVVATNNATASCTRLIAASEGLAVAQKQVVAAQVTNTAAQEAAIAAETVHQASLAKLTVGARLYALGVAGATAATNLFSGAIALVGGPIGVAVIAVGTLTYAWNKLVKAEEDYYISRARRKNESPTRKLLYEVEEAEKELNKLKNDALKEKDPVQAKINAQAALEADISKRWFDDMERKKVVLKQISDMEIAAGGGRTGKPPEKLLLAKEELNNINESINSYGKLKRLQAEIADERERRFPYKENTPKPEVDKEAEKEAKRFAKEVRSAYESLIDLQDEYQLAAIRSGKATDELGAKLAAVDARIANDMERLKLAFQYKDDKVGAAGAREYIKAQGEIEKKNITIATNEKARKALERIEAKSDLDNYKSSLTERSAALKEQVEDDKITQQQYYLAIGNLIQEESAKELNILQKVVDEKKGMLAKLMEQGPVRYDIYAEAIGNLKDAESDLNKVRSDAAKKQHDNSRLALKDLEEQRKAILELQIKNTVDEAQLKSDRSQGKGIGLSSIDDQIEAEKAAIKAKYDVERDAIEQKIAQLTNVSNMQLEQIETVHQAQMLAIDKENEKRIAGISDEALRNSESKRYAAEKLKIDTDYTKKSLDIKTKGAKQATTFIAALEKAYWLTYKKQEEESVKVDEEGWRSKTAVISGYMGIAAGMLTELANAEDQSSRKGFEAAKNYSLAAAIMATATAIMQQLATPGPVGWVKAAAAAAMGAIQIAKIQSTSYGGGSTGGVTAGFGTAGGSSSDSYGVGGAGSGIGDSIGSQITSIHDSLSLEAFQKIADSTENASMALTKVADGLTDIADIFKTEMGSLLGKTLTSEELTNPLKEGLALSFQSFFKGMGLGFTNPFAAIFESISGGLEALFGWGSKWYTDAIGLIVNMTAGGAGVQMYTHETKSGGLLGSDSEREAWGAIVGGLQDSFQGYFRQIKSTIDRASVILGTSPDYSKATTPYLHIQTSGRTAEDIQKDLEKWFTEAADALGQTVTGLKEFTYYGESAFDALIRLAGALQGVNEKLSLVQTQAFGFSLPSTLKGANQAFRITDLFGGLEEFSDAVDTYFESMFTEAEQNVRKSLEAQHKVKVAFDEISASKLLPSGLNLPKTNEEFTKFVGVLDMTSDAGAALFKAMMDVAPAFAEMTKLAADFASMVQDSVNDLTVREMRVKGLDAAADIYALQIAQQEEIQDYLEKGLETTQLLRVQQLEYAKAVKEANDSMAQSAKDAILKELGSMVSAQIQVITTLKSIMGGTLSTLSPEAKYNQQSALFNSTAGRAKLGDTEALQSISQISQDFLSASRDYNASGAGYVSDYNRVTGALAELGGLSSTTDLSLDIAQKQLDNLLKLQEVINTGDMEQILLLKDILNTNNSYTVLFQDWMHINDAANGTTAKAMLAMAMGTIANPLGFTMADALAQLKADALYLATYATDKNKLETTSGGGDVYRVSSSLYSVPVVGSADNKETNELLKQQNALLQAQNVELKALVVVNQAIGTTLIAQGEVANANAQVIAQKTSLAASL